MYIRLPSCVYGNFQSLNGFIVNPFPLSLPGWLCTLTYTPLIWWKVVAKEGHPLSRVNISEQSDWKGGRLCTSHHRSHTGTTLAHTPIVPPWPELTHSWASQSIYMEKSWPGEEGNPTIKNGWTSFKPSQFFCFSCKWFVTFCEEMYEKLAQSPSVAWIGEWPFYPGRVNGVLQLVHCVRTLKWVTEIRGNNLFLRRWNFLFHLAPQLWNKNLYIYLKNGRS